MNIQGVRIPERVTFTRGRQGPMAQLERNGVKIRLVPNRNAEPQPAPGETWKVDYQFTLQEDPGYAVAVVGVSPEAADLSAFVSNEPKTETKPKQREKRPRTGRFVGEEREIVSVNLDGPNVLPRETREMKEARERQLRMARHVPRRGSAVSGIGSKGAARRKNLKK